MVELHAHVDVGDRHARARAQRPRPVRGDARSNPAAGLARSHCSLVAFGSGLASKSGSFGGPFGNAAAAAAAGSSDAAATTPARSLPRMGDTLRPFGRFVRRRERWTPGC